MTAVDTATAPSPMPRLALDPPITPGGYPTRMEASLLVWAVGLGCDVWGGDGDGVALIRTLVVEVELAKGLPSPLVAGTFRVGSSPMLEGKVSLTRDQPRASLEAKHPLDHTTVAWLDRAPDAIPVTVSLKLEDGSILEAATHARWRACMAPPEPPLSPDQVQAAVRIAMPAIRACLRDQPLPGGVSPRLVIGAEGRVVQADVGCPACGPELRLCLQRGLEKMRFPPPMAGTVTLSWPWNVDPSF